MSEIIYNENFVSNSKFTSTPWSWQNIYGLVNVCSSLRHNQCVCVSVYVFMYVCVFVYACVCVLACICAYLCVCMCVYSCVCLFMFLCLHVCVCVCDWGIIRLKGKCSKIHQYQYGSV